jgi:hypothetical protein
MTRWKGPTRQRCRACNAPLVSVITTAGRTMPLDPEPDPKGNIRYTGRRVDSAAGVPTDEVEYINESTEMKLDEARYVSHFATCPQPEKFRKK